MYQLLETIRIEYGEAHLLEYHQERMNCAAQEFWQGVAPNLQVALMRMDLPLEGVHKCRIVYGKEIEKIEILPYAVRNIQSLKLVEGGNVMYNHKWNNRSGIDALYENKGASDDILIVKNGRITDTSYCNVVLGSNETGWVTPSSPLLGGVMRQYLIDNEEIAVAEVAVADLNRYKYVRLINAMMPWKVGPEFSTNNIHTLAYDYR